MTPTTSAQPPSPIARVESRRREAAEKVERVRRLIDERSLDAVLLSTQPNVSWILAGVDHLVGRGHDRGFAWALITPEETFVLALNNEQALLRDELAVEEIGFQLVSAEWWRSTLDDVVVSVRPGARLATDAYGPGEPMLEAIQRLRLVLTEGERERIRNLGADTCAAVEEVLLDLDPTEFRSLEERGLGAQIVSGFERRGVHCAGLLIGGSERRRTFRHPTVTAAPLGDDVLVVVVGMRGGLNVALSRIASARPVDDQTAERQRVVATVEAEMVAASRGGSLWVDALEAGLSAYAGADVPDAWRDHHQGGPIGYGPREFIVCPRASNISVSDPQIHEHQAYAWNPTLVGAKSEDTFLVTANGFETVSNSADWPMLSIDSAAGVIERPAILEL